MVSGGLGATDGGSSDARAMGTRALGGPSSGPSQNIHAARRSAEFTSRYARYVHPSRVVGRHRPVAYAPAPGSVARSIEDPAIADFSVPAGRERWVGRYQVGLVAIDLLAALIAV